MMAGDGLRDPAAPGRSLEFLVAQLERTQLLEEAVDTLEPTIVTETGELDKAQLALAPAIYGLLLGVFGYEQRAWHLARLPTDQQAAVREATARYIEDINIARREMMPVSLYRPGLSPYEQKVATVLRITNFRIVGREILLDHLEPEVIKLFDPRKHYPALKRIGRLGLLHAEDLSLEQLPRGIVRIGYREREIKNVRRYAQSAAKQHSA